MKVKDGIVGLIIGDALGVPFEFYSRNELLENPITGMEGYGTYNMPPGTWSDDTSMTLATMQSIVNKKAIDYDDIMNEFVQWMFFNKYTQYGETFDYGNTTGRALQKYKNGTPANECGGRDERSNGNGSLMRILPLAFIKDIDIETIENISALTHGHPRSKMTCVYYIEIAKSMLERDLIIDEHIEYANNKIQEYYEGSEELIHFERIFTNDFSEGILSSGYVINTIETVIYCLRNTDNFRDALLKCVNLGGDTDTNGAICGGLAGIYYGYDSIPEEWIDTIVGINKVLDLCDEFGDVCDEYL